jgi:hypothetical protein
MKKCHPHAGKRRAKQVACTVSAAALMLGVSEAATVGLHFQVNYCDSQDYTGFQITQMAFGIATNGWQNLTPMDTGYSCGAYPQPGVGDYFTLEEDGIGSTNTTPGLNPLPNGSLNVIWSAYTANYDPFAGYGAPPPNYYGPGGQAGALAVASAPISGEQQVYASFLRDGLNFGPGGANNDQPGYLIDVTGLKSLFPSSSFVVELIASADSTQVFTNAFVVDVANSKTNSVSYPNTPPVLNTEGTIYYQGTGGGLSTGSAPFTNIDEIRIFSATPYHSQTGTTANPGSNFCGTISGFILTDKPVVTMSAQPVVAGPHDSVLLNPYAIGVPPLAYQWHLNGVSIPGGTNLSYTISNLTASMGGNYTLVVTNNYGSTTSLVTTLTVDKLSMALSNNFVADTNPTNAPRVGVDYGATWLASDSDGTTTRSGVMQFVALETNEIVVGGVTNFETPTGTITFWMRSAGTDSGNGAALFGQAASTSTSGSDFIIAQTDGGNIFFNAPNGNNSVDSFTSSANISDNKWHLIALTYDQSSSGAVSLYIDGNLDTAGGNSTAWALPASAPIQIASSADPYWGSYNGALDDVRVYSRQLTAAEIASVFSTGSLVDASTLQMELNFDSPPGDGFILSWQLPGAVLQSATSVTGPYTDVLAAPSPYDVSSQSGQKFYRYRFEVLDLISNPYLM